MSGPNDDVNTMRDLLQLLDSADGKDLAEFLESEHRELLHLRQKVAQYETAIVELSNNFARTLAQVQGKQPVPTTPQSSKYAADHSIHESVHDLQRITDLEQIVMEQKSDIADLEASLRERKVQIRSLRKQLRDKELRQFAVASECVGLRRTPSIMVSAGSGGLLAHLNNTNASFGKTILPNRPASAMSRISSTPASSPTASASTSSNSSPITRRRSSRRPSRFINGWPVYDDNNPDIANPKPPIEEQVTNSPDVSVGTTSQETKQTPPHVAAVLYKQSIASELNTSFAETKSTSSLKVSTPKLLRSVVSSGPRRIYSRLSNKLKKQ